MQTNRSYVARLVIMILLCSASSLVLAHEWMAPDSESKKANPVPLNPISINKGKLLYENNCSHCHGQKALGTSPDDTGLNMATPNLLKRLKTHTDGDFFWKIQNGKGEMPSFKEDLNPEETWHIVNYLRSRIK